jgi:exodeoxyribonuclease VII small subunit
MSEGTPSHTEPVEPERSYEAARDELVDVVRRLESGGTSLEESLALWERGEALAKVCQGWLDGARKRLRAAMEPQNAASGDDASNSQSDD